MTRRLAALSLTVVIAACAGRVSSSAPRLVMSSGAVGSEYAAYGAAGAATLVGKATATPSGGDIKRDLKRAAGSTVTLDPATEYALEWHNKIGKVRDRFAEMPPDTLFRKARRTTVADADGKFQFSNLSAGKYLVRTLVTWEAPGSPNPIQGGVVSAVVIIKDGQKVALDMGRVFRADGSQ